MRRPLASGLAPLSIVVYALLAWSLLVEFAGGFTVLGRWVLDTSIFHHMASAPAVSPGWMASGIMVGLGALAMGLGAITFNRRDLQGE